MEKEKRKIQEDVAATQSVLDKLTSHLQKEDEQVETLKKDMVEKKQLKSNCNQDILTLQNDIRHNEEFAERVAEQNKELYAEIKTKQIMRRARLDDIKKLEKEINKEHKVFKKKEHENLAITEQYKALTTQHQAT